MLESVHCPTCSTHYGLKAPRVRIGIRRARCFRCSSIFSIEQEVQRLIGTPEAEAAATEMGIGPEDFLDLQPLLEEVPAPGAQEASPEPRQLADAMPSLTLGDLEGVEEEILEKTLVMEEPLDHPEIQRTVPSTTPATTTPEDLFDSTAGGYSSAKDAIAKLLGNLPAPEPPQERRNISRSAAQMDVEATLDALETTLGGVSPKDLETKPLAPPPELKPAELKTGEPTASTMKLTHDEIMSAMKAASLPIPSTPPRPAMVPPPAPVPVPTMVPHPIPSPEAEASLLKVQVEQEVYNNISMDQITAWIEQGRVQDFHMVARQFSENWIEAGKVPALRPVFERIRRQQVPAAQQSQAVILPPPNETAPIKKSLFGGLFNRG